MTWLELKTLLLWWIVPATHQIDKSIALPYHWRPFTQHQLQLQPICRSVPWWQLWWRKTSVDNNSNTSGSKDIRDNDNIYLEEPVRVASPHRINLEEPVWVASPTRINLEEPISSGYPARLGLTWRNPSGWPAQPGINPEEPVRVASPHRINLEEPVRVASPHRINLFLLLSVSLSVSLSVCE